MQENKDIINNEEEAFEFLLNRLHDEKRKAEWAESLGSTADYNSNQKTKKKPKQRVIQSKKYLTRISYIAACFLVLLSVSFWVLNPSQSTQSLAMSYIEETNINIQYSIETRGTSVVDLNDENNDLKKELAKALYKDDFSQAVGIFRVFEKQERLEIRDKYFFATSLMKIKDEDHYKAISLLSDIVKEKGELYEEALWFRTLAYGLVDNKVKMKIDLETILENSNYQKSQAKMIFKKLYK